MIRKTIIVVLTLGAFAVMGVNCASQILGDLELYQRNNAFVGGGVSLDNVTADEGEIDVGVWHGGDVRAQEGQVTREWLVAGLEFRQQYLDGMTYYVDLVVPLIYPLILFAAYPTIAFVCGPVRRYRRRRKGLCLKCGYDLTGNVSGTCPECGVAL